MNANDNETVRDVCANKHNPYADVHVVCFTCALAAGFVKKDKVVGVWTDECGICHRRKACTNLWHDWKMPKAVKA